MAETKFEVLNGGSKNPELLKCFETKLTDVHHMTLEELFVGFNSIKAITFSFRTGFLDYLLQYFDYAEVILGADYLVEKDQVLPELLASVDETRDQIKKYPKLMKMIKAKDLEIHIPKQTLDHRKLYILKSDDNKRTRVIVSSANLSKSAWNNEHMELYVYDDSRYAYDEYSAEFETIWNDSYELPYESIAIKQSRDVVDVDENIIIKRIKETGKIIIQLPEKDPYEDPRYVIQHEKYVSRYREYTAKLKPTEKNGTILLQSKDVETINKAIRKIRSDEQKKNPLTREYPKFRYDMFQHQAFLDDIEFDLTPSDESVKQDIETWLQIFNNYDMFIGNTDHLKLTQYKLFNAIFSSPFHAAIRSYAAASGIMAGSVPMFIMITSDTANCGKTFSVKTAIRMMTGKEIQEYHATDYKKAGIEGTIASDYGLPVFIDELSKRIYSNIKDVLKNEKVFSDEQPVIIFAGNELPEPDEIIRKRIIYLRIDDISMPTSLDRTAYQNKGTAIRKSLGTAFYREYLRRMLPKVEQLINYMQFEVNKDDGWYPDILATSSEVIREIITDHGYEIPEFMIPLCFNNDYAMNSQYVFERALHEIKRLYKTNPKCFTIDKEYIKIELGADPESKKRIQAWVDTLPNEVRAKKQELRETTTIVMNRVALESVLGEKLKKRFFPFFGG